MSKREAAETQMRNTRDELERSGKWTTLASLAEFLSKGTEKYKTIVKQAKGKQAVSKQDWKKYPAGCSFQEWKIVPVGSDSLIQ